VAYGAVNNFRKIIFKFKKARKGRESNGKESRDGSHRDSFIESLETFSAVESQSWVFFLGYRFLNS
jgi:hypothetical protein